MYYAYVFHQDPCTKKFVARREGVCTQNVHAAINMVEKAKKEGYVIRLGSKTPIWNNVKKENIPCHTGNK